MEETSIFYACRSGDLNIVKYLIAKDANIYKFNILGENPFYMACESGDEDLVKYFIEELEANVHESNM